MHRDLISLQAVLLALTIPSLSTASKPIEFNRDIRPILSDKCFSCHGPDEHGREADLRLDERESALEYGVIVPEDVEESLMFERILSDDPDLVMPPPHAHKTVTPAEVEILKQWVTQGAEYQKHWSLIAPKRPTPPTVKKAEWAQGAIDRFVLARLEAEGMAPSRAADKATLLRRVTLDLTGLPPTPEELTQFLGDDSPDAYENAVDRLLESPRYGEHMARYWLDAARYGDTHGLHLDNYREIWPYRDWVVRAFNANMRYDDFTTAQLAGDLLPNRTTDDLVATGFNRCNLSTNEGGSIKAEVKMRNVVDRVDTFGTVFLGMTMGCSRCHDHKFDPITAADYYSLYAYFNSMDGPAMDDNRKDPAPVLQAPSPQQQKKIDRLERNIAAAKSRLNADWPELDKQQRQWEQALSAAQSELAAEEEEPLDGAVSTSAPADIILGQWQTIGPFKQSISPHALEKGYAKVAVIERNPVDLTRTYPEGWDKNAWQAKPEWIDGVTHSDLPSVNAVNYLYRKLTAEQPQTIRVLIGTDNATQLFLNGKPVFDNNEDAYEKTRTAPHSAADKTTPVELALKAGENHLLWRIVNYQGRSAFRFNVAESAPVIHEGEATAIATPTSKRTPQQSAVVRSYFRYNLASSQERDELVARYTEDRGTLADIKRQAPTTLAWREKPKPEPAFILNRGEYDQPGEQVERRTPGFLPTFDADLPKDRMGLAKWLLQPEHPLTSRVAVNRFWQQLFGVGLVKTSEDLGSQGEPPSHPQLLDWLAIDFVESGWDVKRLMKRMVLSATYRQDAAANADKRAQDPENRLVARGPRFRLDAETLRDQALQVGGLLVDRLGGSPVKPPQPAGLWHAVAYSKSNTAKFVADESTDKVHRRTLYTFVKRTAVAPQLAVLDGPNRESCIVRRERTNTPLQALLLMNDPQYLEAAIGLAERVLKAHEAPAKRAEHMRELAFARPARSEEVRRSLEAFQQHLANFQTNPEGAERFTSIGVVPIAEGRDRVELAAWTMVASVLMNSDEFVNKP